MVSIFVGVGVVEQLDFGRKFADGRVKGFALNQRHHESVEGHSLTKEEGGVRRKRRRYKARRELSKEAE